MKKIRHKLLVVVLPFLASYLLYHLELVTGYVIIPVVLCSWLSSGLGHLTMEDSGLPKAVKVLGFFFPGFFMFFATALSLQSGMELSNPYVDAEHAIHNSAKWRVMSVAITWAIMWGFGVGLATFLNRVKNAWENGILIGTRTQTASLVLVEKTQVVHKPTALEPSGIYQIGQPT